MNFQKILTLITPYSLFVSILYLFGFWSSFDVNILEYIALSDVLKSAMTPLLYSALIVMAGFLAGSMLSIPLSKKLPPGGGRDLPSAKYFDWVLNIVITTSLLAIMYQILFESGNDRWFKVALLSMLVIPAFVGDVREVERYIPHRYARIFIVNVLVTVAVFAFGWGAVDANAKKNSQQYLKINGVSVEYKYVGWAGDFLFLWDNEAQTVIARAKGNVNSIEYEVIEKKSIFERYMNKE